MSKVVIGKGKTFGKNGKTGKWTKEQDNESTLSFQNYDSRRLLMFLYQVLHKEKETSYLTLCMANFGWMATSLMESERQLGAPPVPVAFTNEFFLFLTEWSSFFLLRTCFFFSFLFILPSTLYRFWFFHEQRFFHKRRASTCEFCELRDVNKIHEYRASTWAVAAKISPRDSPRFKIMTPSWFINFYLKIRFSK